MVLDVRGWLRETTVAPPLSTLSYANCKFTWCALFRVPANRLRCHASLYSALLPPTPTFISICPTPIYSRSVTPHCIIFSSCTALTLALCPQLLAFSLLTSYSGYIYYVHHPTLSCSFFNFLATLCYLHSSSHHISYSHSFALLHTCSSVTLYSPI